MNVSIFKPNSKSTGAAGHFQIGQKGDEEPTFFLRVTQQHSWDDARKTGSFSGNTKEPSKNVVIKFNEFELGEIVNAFRNKSAWSSYHDFNDVKISITLSPWQKKVGKGDNVREYTAFGLSITRNGVDKFKLPIEPGEGVRLESLVNTFYAYIDEARRIKNLSFVKPTNGGSSGSSGPTGPTSTTSGTAGSSGGTGAVMNEDDEPDF